ncbi:unnamed protein product [Vicia faba]|uniref:Uncharacterized protein n=1 Tax=Vicia faba TaxID=3906 RepID=A0AAV0ZQD6_VICFA|nr:unnamed protein product [Vicia faba]
MLWDRGGRTKIQITNRNPFLFFNRSTTSISFSIFSLCHAHSRPPLSIASPLFLPPSTSSDINSPMRPHLYLTLSCRLHLRTEQPPSPHASYFLRPFLPTVFNSLFPSASSICLNNHSNLRQPTSNRTPCYILSTTETTTQQSSKVPTVRTSYFETRVSKMAQVFTSFRTSLLFLDN